MRKLRHPKRHSARYTSAPSPALSRSPSISAASNGVGYLVKAAPRVRDRHCEESPRRLRCCPSLEEEQRRRGIADASADKVAFAASHSMFLCEPFGLPDPFLPPPEETPDPFPPPVQTVQSASPPSFQDYALSRLLAPTSEMGRWLPAKGARDPSERSFHAQEAVSPTKVKHSA
ncbi:hypothetical protein CGC20_21175 [Leishmania donovani]|uniref:Uncharacterized protein n=1 Tax=Leishmania donovani TaxID=5661 RepID=A0A504XGN4_LEIDO|nr:hypothetical protein CGC20_21175 [Leishmania donovani]